MKPARILAVFDVSGCVVLASSLLLLHVVFVPAREMRVGAPGRSETSWREAPSIRVIMRSTADWARIMFDDEVGNNTNGIRFKRILSFGWLGGNDSDDEISIGKGTWYDVLYNVTVERTGDIVAFDKRRNDFDYAEMYADIVFETDAGMISGYIWLMLAGQGITTFQLANLEHQYVLWQETLSGTGHTRHVRRYLMLDSFYRRWEVSPTSIAVLTLVALLVMVLLSPIIPSRKRRQVGRTHLTNRMSSTSHPVALEQSL